MTRLSPLSLDPGFALAFRTLQPPPERPRSLLVLLHGVGGNEGNLAELGAQVGNDTLVVFPRGPITMGPEAFGWFRVAFTGNGPRIDAAEADASRRTLIQFIEQLQQDHGIDDSSPGAVRGRFCNPRFRLDGCSSAIDRKREPHAHRRAQGDQEQRAASRDDTRGSRRPGAAWPRRGGAERSRGGKRVLR